jgi:Zn-dependent oligopeptidase
MTCKQLYFVQNRNKVKHYFNIQQVFTAFFWLSRNLVGGNQLCYALK